MLAVCYPRCGTCKKAVKWLEENGIERLGKKYKGY